MRWYDTEIRGYNTQINTKTDIIIYFVSIWHRLKAVNENVSRRKPTMKYEFLHQNLTLLELWKYIVGKATDYTYLYKKTILVCVQTYAAYDNY